MNKIFKPTEISGIYSETLTESIAFQIGRAVASHFLPSRVVVAVDGSAPSKALRETFVFALLQHGVDVFDLDESMNPFCAEIDADIYAIWSTDSDGVTKLKLFREKNDEISEDDFMSLKMRIESVDYVKPPNTMGLRQTVSL